MFKKKGLTASSIIGARFFPHWPDDRPTLLFGEDWWVGATAKGSVGRRVWEAIGLSREFGRLAADDGCGAWQVGCRAGVIPRPRAYLGSIGVSPGSPGRRGSPECPECLECPECPECPASRPDPSTAPRPGCFMGRERATPVVWMPRFTSVSTKRATYLASRLLGVLRTTHRSPCPSLRFAGPSQLLECRATLSLGFRGCIQPPREDPGGTVWHRVALIRICSNQRDG